MTLSVVDWVGGEPNHGLYLEGDGSQTVHAFQKAGAPPELDVTFLPEGLVFADGFETGDVTLWSTSTP